MSEKKSKKNTATAIQPELLNPDVKPVVEVKEKNPVGSPLKFKTVEDLQLKISEFLQFVKDNDKPYTLERLCCFLDCDLQTLRNYSAKQEFFGTIKRIKDFIFASKMENINTKGANTAGIVFDICNNRSELYSNKHNIEHTGEVTHQHNFNVEKIQQKPPEEIIDVLVKK